MFAGPADAYALLFLSPAALAWRLVIFVALAIVLPGAGLLRAAGSKEGGLVLPVGASACSALSGLALWAGQSWIFPLGLLGASLLKPGCLRRHRFRVDRAAVGAALIFLGLVAGARGGGNRLTEEGSFSFERGGLKDNAFHVGAAFELATGRTPEVPGLSGVPLRYHFGQDLIRAAAFRFAGVHPYDSLTSLEPVLGGLAVILAFPVVARAMSLPALAVAVSPWLVLASDASVLLAPWAEPGYWVDRTRMNFALQLLLGNAGSPLAIASALGTIALLTEPGAGRRALAGLLAAMTALFKVFVAAQLAVGLLLAGLVVRRRPAWLQPLVPLAIAALALSWGATSGTEIAWSPGEQARSFGASFGIISPWLAGGLWLLVGFGGRWLGAGRLVAALTSDSAARIAVAGATLTGLLAGSLFAVRIREALHSERVFNDAAYFLEQGGLLLWLFAAWQISMGPRTRLVSALILGLSFPATLQAFLRFSTQPRVSASPESVRAMGALSEASRAGDVVVVRLQGEHPPLPVVLLGLRVPVSNFFGYLTRYEEVGRIESTETSVRTFFTTEDPREAQTALARVRAAFVLFEEYREPLFPIRGVLRPVWNQSGVSVYSTHP